MMVKDKKKIKKNKDKKEIVELEMDQDPRRQAFASAYYDPNSNTYSNALQSALKAGFAPDYAKDILFRKPKWIQEIVGKMDILDDLMRNLKAHVNLPTIVPAMGPFGPLINKKTNKPYMVESNVRLKLRQEMTMFGLEHLNPDFKKKDKTEPLGKVEIKQIIIIAPNGQSIPYNSTNSETIFGISETS